MGLFRKNMAAQPRQHRQERIVAALVSFGV